jgi:hypothetical protein
MGETKYWISDKQIKTLLEFARLENESDTKKLLKKIQQSQKIK